VDTRVREADGSVSRYDDVPVTGDTVARLLTELFSEPVNQSPADRWARACDGLTA